MTNPGKHPGGRPSEYDPSFVPKADEYLESCVDVERKTDKGYAVIVRLPKLEGFARYLGVSRQTLHNWADAHPEFLDALERIKIEQKERLIDNGLSGDYNATIAKLVLSSDHDMREKSDTTTAGQPIGSVDQVIAEVEANRQKQ